MKTLSMEPLIGFVFITERGDGVVTAELEQRRAKLGGPGVFLQRDHA
jgi:hypothetical protein